MPEQKEKAAPKLVLSERPKDNKFNFKKDVLSEDHLDFPVFLDKQQSLQQFHSDEPLDRAQLHLYADYEAS
jgi:hypothetical protein